MFRRFPKSEYEIRDGCPSIRPPASTTRLPLDKFRKHLILVNFSKIVENIHDWLKSDMWNSYFR